MISEQNQDQVEKKELGVFLFFFVKGAVTKRFTYSTKFASFCFFPS